jgi:hypothetical protein
MSAGLLNAAKTAISTATADGGAAWLTGSTIAQPVGGNIARPTVPAVTRVSPTKPGTANRVVGALLTANAATAAAGTVTMHLTVRSARYGA